MWRRVVFGKMAQYRSTDYIDHSHCILVVHQKTLDQSNLTEGEHPTEFAERKLAAKLSMRYHVQCKCCYKVSGYEWSSGPSRMRTNSTMTKEKRIGTLIGMKEKWVRVFPGDVISIPIALSVLSGSARTNHKPTVMRKVSRDYRACTCRPVLQYTIAQCIPSPKIRFHLPAGIRPAR